MTQTRANEAMLLESSLTEAVIGVFFDVYNELGHGFLENVYENSLAIGLRDAGIAAIQQAPIRVDFRNQPVGEFRADLLVAGRLIVEVKAVQRLATIHEVQLVNYLKATGIHVGLLMNFGTKPEFRRRVLESRRLYPRSSAPIRVQKHV